MRKTITDIRSCKGPSAEPLVCLTAYTAPTAKIFDAHCDMLLVGDSVAMVVYGEPSTLQADMDMMIRHGRAVQNATQNALIVVDMPFGSYQESKEAAFRNAARILRETGASSVKLEGGEEMAETVAYLATRGVPVMGHVGLQPQSVNTMGGFKAQGRDDAGAVKIMNDAKAIAEAGAYAIVLEGVPEALATDIAKNVSCPVIGIGASAQCDGQILVAEDMLGLIQGKKPKFVKEYADLAKTMSDAVAFYAADVRGRKYPDAAHVYASGARTAPQTTASETLATESKPLSLEEETPKPFIDPVLRATRRF
jgi:3-methyl-2-oxobutanoate hydroxymethyltransferase